MNCKQCGERLTRTDEISMCAKCKEHHNSYFVAGSSAPPTLTLDEAVACVNGSRWTDRENPHTTFHNSELDLIITKLRAVERQREGGK